MTEQNKYLRSVETKSTRTNNLQNKTQVREFNFTIDEPEKLGGTNLAPTPMEYILGSLSGCLMIVIEMVANEKEISIENLEVSAHGEIDKRGLKGTADVSPYFQTAQLDIVLNLADKERNLTDLIEEVTRRCPAYNLFKDTSCEIKLNWKINEEVAG
ncbi:OsmC family protein [Saliterribacillus persicus]|uniref:Putative OsmC-like protein n=1 Tax=Saliterribacillus persicus TaxID=930114 RepID=A0A368YAL0_9BACI|nr:OsmC family protein [Saliterribacillus persicus]RCW77242.1 putative OsmC-like protein [Saliterribacillus persicus]